ncbi:hypothetical protein ADK52_35385 [Streptomyces sp. WM6372]|nr:hypothetical protein ADK52_35385 [Streptomyces sp. WM6372]
MDTETNTAILRPPTVVGCAATDMTLTPDGRYPFVVSVSGLRARPSCMLAPDTATASGMPWASDSACSLLPCLPRSTGFGSVSDPPF